MDIVAAFNEDAARGMANAVQRGIVTNTPAGMADWLLYTRGLAGRAVGIFLCDKANVAVLDAYAALCVAETHTSPFMTALRRYLESYKPAIGAEVHVSLDRLVDAWVTHYLASNTHADHAVFRSHDAAFTLVYSVIMLNVDLHSPVLVGRPRMTMAKYIENVAKLNEGEGWPSGFVESIYMDIAEHEFSLKRQ